MFIYDKANAPNKCNVNADTVGNIPQKEVLRMKNTYTAPAFEQIVLNTLDVIASSAIIADIADDIKDDIFGA